MQSCILIHYFRGIRIMNKKTKIIATIGPGSKNLETILKMVKEGADGFRINFSHGNEEEWQEYIKLIRKAEKTSEKPLAIIGDLQGPNVRVGFLVNPIYLKKNSIITLYLGEKSSNAEIPIPHKAFFDVLEAGDIVSIDDGKILLEITEVYPNKAKARVIIEGVLRSRKSISLRNKDIPMPMVTDKDKKDIEFVVANEFSYIMASFVESYDHVSLLKRILVNAGGKEIPVLAKIETENGVKQAKNIIRIADGIVVARGDLGTHFPLEKLPGLQRELIRLAREKGKPVVLATQLLSSMVTEPVPTRSEVVDVYNAVIEGTDILMLTNETAVGKHPVSSVSWLEKIIIEAESSGISEKLVPEPKSLLQRFASGIVDLSFRIGAKILVYTYSGFTAQQISMYRPKDGFFAGVPDIHVARRLALTWGVKSVVCQADTYDEGLKKTRELLLKKNMIGYGDLVVETYRMKEGDTHIIRIIQVL